LPRRGVVLDNLRPARGALRTPREAHEARPLPLALLGLVGFILLLFWWTRGSAPGAAGGGGAASAARGDHGSETALEPSRELDEQAADPARDKADLAGMPAGDGARRTWRGRVTAPQGCDDDAREVLALRLPGDWDDVAEHLDPHRPREVDEPNELAAAFGAESEVAKLAADVADTTILARAPVAADGRFELTLPAGTKAAWLALSGRFQFVGTALPLDLEKPGEIAIQAECGALVRVSVQLPEPMPPGASLQGEVARIEPSSASMRAVTEAAHRVSRNALAESSPFEFRALPSDQHYVLRLQPARLAAFEQPVEGLRPGHVTEVVMRLRAGGNLRGRVVAPDGAAIAGAAVRATTPGQWFGFDDRTVRSATTDGQGNFELVAVVPGDVTLHADHERYLEGPVKKLKVQDGQAQEGLVLELASGAVIAGRVEWPEGQPAAHAKVRVQFDMSQMYGMSAMNALQGGSGRAEADEEGRFNVPGLGKGPFTVTAEAPERTPGAKPVEGPAPAKPIVWQAREDGVPPGTTTLRLLLAAPIGLRGQVHDEQGAPVTKFSIFAQRTATGPMATLGQASRDQAFEDPQGNFFLPGLIRGRWSVHVSAEGFAQRSPLELELPREDAPLELVLARAARVTGVVKDPGGRSVGGAEVTIATGGANWQRMMNSGPKPPETHTLDDGSFTLAGLVPARVKLVAGAKGFARSLPLELDLAETPETQGVELALREGALLTGEVFDDAGRPAAGWMVQVTDPANFDQEMVFAESDGHFRVEHLQPGTRQIVAMPSGAGRSGGDAGGEDATSDMSAFVSHLRMSSAELVDGQETHVVLGAPPRAPVEVSGNVTHAGAPYSGAMLTFVASGKKLGLSGLKTTTVDKAGHYATTLAEPGDYTISVQKFGASAQQQGLVEFVRSIPEEKSVRLDFEMPTGRISGRVRGPEGEPVSGARISLHLETTAEPGTMWGGQYNESATDNEGRFDLQALKPGKYTVLAGGMSLGGVFGDDAAHGREMKSGLSLTAGEWIQDVDFRLKKPGVIEVSVVDEAGSPVSDASVFVRAHGGELLDQFSMSVTGPDGTCKYGGLAPGRYTVSARSGGKASSDSAETEVREGEHAQLRVALAAGTYLIVNVVDAESKPLRASLSVRDEAGREVGAMFSLADIMKRFTGSGGEDAGDQRIGPLPAGKYRVHAELSDGRSTTKPVTLGGQEERKLTVRF
jgi:protocatechuate 3,4-dioxygenase beta subunit